MAPAFVDGELTVGACAAGGGGAGAGGPHLKGRQALVRPRVTSDRRRIIDQSGVKQALDQALVFAVPFEPLRQPGARKLAQVRQAVVAQAGVTALLRADRKHVWYELVWGRGHSSG